VTFKVDENLPVELADDLRGLGHGSDTVAVEAARAEGRVLLTLDKGIADIVRARLSELLEMPLAGRLTIVGASRIRVR
jgi:predicted nuclease of predicted toxin-antitoxin system